MEDGHTLFDYDVRLNDTIQLLVRQSLALPSSQKERDSELSDTDSGCCLGQSESDKSSTHGEAATDTDSKAGLPDDEDTWVETDQGLYKVGQGGRADPTSLLSDPQVLPVPRRPAETLGPSWQVNEYVDARDTNMGAWFEAQVVRVLRKVQAAEDEPCSSTVSPPSEEDIIYCVKYDE